MAVFGNVFLERALFACRSYQCRVTDIVFASTTMFENEKTDLLVDHFQIKQRITFPNGFSNRRCHFEIVILGLIDAVF